MTKLYTILLGFAFIFLHSCKSASKAYQKGDYTDAIELGVKKLQKEPHDWETRDLVQRSYNFMVSQREDQVRILSNSKADSRFEKIYVEYVELQHLYKTIHLYPAVAEMIKTKDYSEYVATYAEKAADVHVERAARWMDEGTKPAFREAYREFNAALRFRPEDFELRKKRDEAYDAAITKVIISPIQSYGGYQYSASNQLQNFQRDVIRTLSYNMSNDFVRFYTEWEANSKNIAADQVMDLNLSSINVGRPFDQKTSREVSKEVVIKEIYYKPDSVGKQYGTVKAVITATKRTLVSQGDLVISLRDTRGRTIWNDRFTGEHRWQTEFYSYTGDERALSDSDKNLLKNQNGQTPPQDDQIMESLLQQIQTDLSQRLRSYYARF
ncbi:MAG TPA: hypothetical protein VFR58_11365 [Flavisolibacter sp.]|nr:hypothetical protein [Flavisolibacter sp.]